MEEYSMTGEWNGRIDFHMNYSLALFQGEKNLTIYAGFRHV
jgi:hypothetical protein